MAVLVHEGSALQARRYRVRVCMYIYVYIYIHVHIYIYAACCVKYSLAPTGLEPFANRYKSERAQQQLRQQIAFVNFIVAEQWSRKHPGKLQQELEQQRVAAPQAITGTTRTHYNLNNTMTDEIGLPTAISEQQQETPQNHHTGWGDACI